MILGLVFTANLENELAKIVAVGAAIVVMAIGGVTCIRVLLTPKEMIVYEGESLRLASGVTFSPRLIERVTYRLASAKGVQYEWGKLCVFVGGKEYSYHFVADVEQAHNRLIALRSEATEQKK